LHAPSVHVGGGAVLLKELLLVQENRATWVNLDARAAAFLTLPRPMECHFVQPSLFDRLKAEFRLRGTAQPGDIVLCFHGMPPLLPSRGRVIVFQQNRNYLGLNPLSSFSGRTRIRLAAERFICRYFKSHVDEYVVQTPSMLTALKAWHGGNPKVRVIPFRGDVVAHPSVRTAEKTFDFIYVADGESHKNHKNLLAGWILLAQEGIFPSLVLTLPDRYAALLRQVREGIAAHNLRITNMGKLQHEQVLALYHDARVLVFPSMSESLGLPLLEAADAGLPVIASELDYVRDVCVPIQTFDPNSPVSIARAVKRFMNLRTPSLQVRSVAEFLAELEQ
jgi:glycosyltransferase involved in cell wall biosynthesis